jgi:hypothetical protein
MIKVRFCEQCKEFVSDCKHAPPMRSPAQIIAHIESELSLPAHKIASLAKADTKCGDFNRGRLDMLHEIRAMFEESDDD